MHTVPPATRASRRRRRDPFIRAVDLVSAIAGITAALMLLAAVAITCQMIWVRFVMNQSTIWQTEMIVYLMIGSTLLGLSYVQNSKAHVSVDAIPMLLPRRGRKALSIVTLCVSLAVVGAMIYYGYDLWHLAWSRNWKSDTVWGVPLWIPYLAIPVGLGLYLLQMAADLYTILIGTDEEVVVERPAPSRDIDRG